MEHLFSSVINENFFNSYFDIKKQFDINNLLSTYELQSPELKLFIYDYFIYKNKKNFILLKDNILSETIKDYFIVLFDKEINKVLADDYYEKLKTDLGIYKKSIDYFSEYKKVKNSLDYKEFKQKINDSLVSKIIDSVNKDKALLSETIKKEYKNLIIH